jgi:hypothetical protein
MNTAKATGQRRAVGAGRSLRAGDVRHQGEATFTGGVLRFRDPWNIGVEVTT